MKIVKKILKWFGIVIGLMILIPVVLYWVADKYSVSKANDDITALYHELNSGMKMKEIHEKAKKSQSNISLWNHGNEGKAAPKPKNRKIDSLTEDYCLLIPTKFLEGVKIHVARRDTYRIGIVIPKEDSSSHCYTDYIDATDIFLLSNSNEIVEENLATTKEAEAKNVY